MAKKKRKPEGKKDKPNRVEPPVGLPSRQAMEAMMRQLVGGMHGNAQNTPLDQAQNLIYRAFEERNLKRRIELAHEALRICPDCADAHVLLAEHAATRKQALAHYERGVVAGERALGPKAFQDSVGHFWGILETRPYMRARLGLAHALWIAAKRDEAVSHLQEMLRLNPNDNQGVRYTLAGFLLFLDRDDDLARLLEQYPDERSAAWGYTKALLAYRRHGDGPEAQNILKQAIKTNRHVPVYLTGAKFPPAAPPNHYSPGDENEALQYVGSFLAGWKSTLGAVAWLRNSVTKPKAVPQDKEPGAAVKKLINNLPLEDDVWQADCRPFPNWIRIAGEHPARPWVVLVTSESDDLVLGHQISEGTPSSSYVWEALVQAIRHPRMGTPHRPSTLQVGSGGDWEKLRSHIEELGIELEVCEELEPFDDVFADMAAHVGGESPPGLLEMPGMTPERVQGFYEAAAEFYRQAPWKRVGYESAIKVECDKFQSGPWYAVLMGQSGLTMGLALYEDIKALRRMWAQDEGDDDENARETVGTSVTFGEEWEISTADLDAAKKYGWRVARPDAYPGVFRKERGMSMRSLLTWELELLEGCLRAVPEFVARRKQDDSTRQEFVVPTAGGSLKLEMSWVPEVSD